MGVFSSSEETSPADEALERSKEQAAQQTALQQASEQTVKANPQFLRQLQSLDVDSEEYPELSEVLGPETSGANILGNRPEKYEKQQFWLNRNKAERMAAEGNPGRLCKGKTREIALGVHKRDNRSKPSRYTSSEKRVIRSAMERVTNMQSLSVDSRALRALTESIAVTKNEGSSESVAERSANLL